MDCCTSAVTVADPIDPESPLSIGQLARRIVLSFSKSFSQSAPLNIGQFLDQMSRSEFDPETSSVVTLSTPKEPSRQLIKYPLMKLDRAELRVGPASFDSAGRLALSLSANENLSSLTRGF